MDYPLQFRAVGAVEEMDRPDCDPAKLTRTYDQFGLINSVVSGWRRVYVRQIRPRLSRTTTASLLDVGCGGGDVTRAIARWAARDGLLLEVTGIDPDDRAYRYATAQPPMPGVTFRPAFSSELVGEGQQFDFVISNHILHHLSSTEMQGLLHDSELLCRVTAIHADIARSPLAYTLFSLGTLPFFPGSYIRRDGLTSIRRSYTQAELTAVVPPPWRVLGQAPWVNLLCFDADGSGPGRPAADGPAAGEPAPDGPPPVRPTAGRDA